MRLWEQAPEIRCLSKEDYKLYIRVYYLKTKESYDRWVTRRVWEFRHQISKEKYLKMSVAHVGKIDSCQIGVSADSCPAGAP